jgi:hypothetical protein
MIRWHYGYQSVEEKIMPEFTTVALKEAKVQTTSGRQSRYLHEYIDYITNLPKGQAGRLRIEESENTLTVRSRLVSAANALNISLIIKRSGNDIYFWREDGGDEQPRTKRSYTRRMKSQDAIPTPDQPITEPEEFEQVISEQTTLSDRV